MSKCLIVADFEKYYTEATQIKNMENIAVGCKIEGLDGPELNKFAYSG